MKKTNPVEILLQKRKAIMTHLMNNINGIQEHDAEDAVMDAIQKLLQFGVDKVRHPQAWLSKTAFRIACHAQKKRERENARVPSSFEIVSSEKMYLIKKGDAVAKEILKMRISGSPWHVIAKTLRISKKTAKIKCRNLLEEI